MFGKNKQKKQEESASEDLLNMPPIHVMPQVFLSAAAQKVKLKKKKKTKKKEDIKKKEVKKPDIAEQKSENLIQQPIKKPTKKTGRKRLIHPSILILVILLIGILGAAVIYLITQKDEPTNDITINTNTAPATNTNQVPVNINKNTNNNIPKLICGDGIISPELQEECDDGNNVSGDGCSAQCRTENQPVFNQQITLFTSYPTTNDSDEDFLTDVEENLYGTSINNADQDGDTYLDGLELINLYDPKHKTPASLVDSGIVNIFNNQEQGYSLFYPKEWKVRYASEDRGEVYFESGTVEFVQVLVSDNPQKESITAWAKKQFKDIEISKLERVGVGDKLGIKSPNGLTVNFSNEDKIYSVTYQVSTLRSLNFKATFQMMYKSLKLYSRSGGVDLPENQWPSYINNQLGVKLQYPVNLEVIANEDNSIQIDDFSLYFINNEKASDFEDWFWETYGKTDNEYCQLKSSELKIGKLTTFFVDKSAEDKETSGAEKQCSDGGYYAMSGDQNRIVKLNIGDNPAREMAQILATIQLFESESSLQEAEPLAESELPPVDDADQPAEQELVPEVPEQPMLDL